MGIETGGPSPKEMGIESQEVEISNIKEVSEKITTYGEQIAAEIKKAKEAGDKEAVARWEKVGDDYTDKLSQIIDHKYTGEGEPSVADWGEHEDTA